MSDELPDETPMPEGIAPDDATQRLLWLLKARHPTDRHEWATFEELRSCAGFGDARYIDFLAMHTFEGGRGRGGGLKAVAYEIKTSRADFGREIKKPEKRAFAESIADECFFAMPAGLVRVDEVPDGWGLIEANKAGLRVIKQPLQRQPGPWPRTFVAMMARRMADPPLPKAPPKLWRFVGQELSLDDVLSLVYQHVPHEAERMANKRFAEIKDLWERNAARNDAGIRGALAHHMGVDLPQVDAYRVREWLATLPTSGGLTRKQISDLNTAARIVERVLMEVRPSAPKAEPT